MMWLCLFIFLLLGCVGFLDDYIKLKRKHNDGLSARAKFAGQILAGLLLGVYLVNNPITVSAARVFPRDILDWSGLARVLVEAGKQPEQSAVGRVWGYIPQENQARVRQMALRGRVERHDRELLLAAMNAAVSDPDFYVPALWPIEAMSLESRELLGAGLKELSEREQIRFNRLLLEAAFPQYLSDSKPNLHTKIGCARPEECADSARGALYSLCDCLDCEHLQCRQPDRWPRRPGRGQLDSFHPRLYGHRLCYQPLGLVALSVSNLCARGDRGFCFWRGLAGGRARLSLV